MGIDRLCMLLTDNFSIKEVRDHGRAGEWPSRDLGVISAGSG